MNEFSAESIYNTGRTLVKIRFDAQQKEKNLQLSPSDTQAFLGILNTIEKKCSALALRHSLKAVEELMEAIGEHERTYGDFADDIWDIQRSLRRELAEQLFMFIPPHRADHYTKAKALFSQTSRTAFPSAEYDMTEAAKCFATGRYTACVFHLMRVTEAGLRALVHKIGPPLKWQNNWGQNLASIKEELEIRCKTGKGTSDTQLYSEAGTQIAFIKANRNSTMHLNRVYTDEQAEELFDSTKALMRILSERISE